MRKIPYLYMLSLLSVRIIVMIIIVILVAVSFCTDTNKRRTYFCEKLNLQMTLWERNDKDVFILNSTDSIFLKRGNKGFYDIELYFMPDSDSIYIATDRLISIREKNYKIKQLEYKRSLVLPDSVYIEDGLLDSTPIKENKIKIYCSTEPYEFLFVEKGQTVGHKVPQKMNRKICIKSFSASQEKAP